MKRLSAHQKRYLKRRQQRSQRPIRRSRTRRVPRGEQVWESSLAGFVFKTKSEEPEDFPTWTAPEQERWWWENADYEMLPNGWQILRQAFGLEVSTAPLSGAEVSQLWSENLSAHAPDMARDDRQDELQFLLDVAYFLTTGNMPIATTAGPVRDVTAPDAPVPSMIDPPDGCGALGRGDDLDVTRP
jgi:hypothetical protein